MLRRVVSATDARGNPFFAEDSTLTARTADAMPGVAMHYIWGSDERALPRDGSQPSFPGLFGTIEPDTTGMHTSETVDLIVVLSGQVTLQLRDSLEKELNTGDTVIQVGNVHRWVNNGVEPAVVAGVVVGASYGGDSPASS